MNDDHDHEHDRGLAHDIGVLATRFSRRREMLRWLGGAALLPAAACLDTVVGTGGTGGAGGSGDGGSCEEIPEETAGPYPGDGSNGKNALTIDGVVRSDIRKSFGSASGVAEGVPLTVKLKLVSASGCTAIAGRAIYLWHCDREGNYSMYAQTLTSENYLRGVQETGDDGTVTFTTIFPGCYSGRWPHIHFEIFPSLDEASSSSDKLATSQLALPESACVDAYAEDGYENSVRNLEDASLDDDNVFGDDDAALQLATVTGDSQNGYVATLTVAI